MFRSLYGPIINPKTGESKDIIVNAITSKNIKDVLIGSGIVLIGITYLALSAFTMKHNLPSSQKSADYPFQT